ncbi:glycosyltransferase [Microbacterium sp. KHB019]|uniref:glycosyltransferase n=1 Tax=Microbacterium sp. KHB019 TaxID=3129770 RepID=UPI00307ABF01
MKILHLVPLHIPASGIVQQAIAEQRAADETDIDWDVRLFTDIDLPEAAESLRIWAHPHKKSTQRSSFWLRYVADKIEHRRRLYKWIGEHHLEYDVILLRYTTSDLSRARTLSTISTPVVSMHHTLEIPELKLIPGYQRYLQVAMEALVGPRNLRAASAIAGVTEEIVDYELARTGANRPTLTFPNGINLDQQPVAADHRGNVPEILFVASKFVEWHGLDLVLEDMSRSDEEFTLHLVGEVEPADLERASHDPRVKIHGRLTKEEIGDLIARSWVGLSSFALERKSMREACTLKVREYLAAGLPTYSGHRDRFPADAPYYRQGPANIRNILDYARSMRTHTRSDIRQQSAPLLSKANIIVSTHDLLAKMPARSS